MKAPLYEAVTKYEPRARFHMPAHFADETLCPLYFCSRYDITELSFSDNLLAPEGVIKEAEELAAKAFHADNALFVTSGATSAIQISLIAADAKKVLIFGNAHRSVYEAIRLFNMEGYVCQTMETAKECVQNNDIDTLYAVSPDYFGRCLDLQSLKQFATDNNLKFIVDSAHGAHFSFCSKLPISATEYADLVIYSCHKTLPVYTGGAVLAVKKEYFERALFARSAVHTSSPSYLIMASIDYARAYLDEFGEEKYNSMIETIDRFILESKTDKYSFYYNDDPTHLLLKLNGFDADGLTKDLERKGIYSEMNTENEILFLISPFNIDKLSILKNAIKEIELNTCNKEKLNTEIKNIKKIYGARFKLIKLEDAIGERVYREVGIYPPGTPLYFQGDRLTEEDVSYLIKRRDRLFGLVNGYVSVLK